MRRQGDDKELWPVLVGAAALLALVALASGASPFRARTSTSSGAISAVTRQPQPVPTGGISWLFPLVVLVVVVLIVILTIFKPRGPEAPGRSRRFRWLALFLVPAALFLRLLLGRRHSSAGQRSTVGSLPPVTAPKLAIGARSGSASEWSLVVVLVVLALALLLARTMMRRRRQGAGSGSSQALDPGGFADPPAAAQAVALSLEQLRSIADPRAAVLAAYQAMTDTLTEHGLGPLPSETAYEHLARTLTASPPAQAALVSLTDRFALARFSAHAVTEADRQAAVDALLGVRDAFRVDAGSGVGR